jgi:hypothetical protein
MKMGDARARISGQGSARGSEDVPLRERYLLAEIEVAALCGVSRHTVRRWKDAGLLRTVELPFGLRRNLYRRSDVEAFLDKRES